MACPQGRANLFDRKRLLFLLVGPRRGRANSCEFASRIETRNAYRGERNEQHTRARRTRSSSLDLSSFQRYRSTIRHRRRYTYTYNFSPPSPVDRRGATHLFEHAILSFPSRFSRHPAHLDWIIAATRPLLPPSINSYNSVAPDSLGSTTSFHQLFIAGVYYRIGTAVSQWNWSAAFFVRLPFPSVPRENNREKEEERLIAYRPFVSKVGRARDPPRFVPR